MPSLRISLLLALTMGFPTPQRAGEPLERSGEVAGHYARIVLATYRDSLAEAEALRKVIREFTARPSEERFRVAKETWIRSRRPYLQTEVYRFYGGPIDDDNGPEALINAWPIDEAYIDYVEGAPQSGIINDPAAFPEITPFLVETANERGGETMISCGFHAIEFLLWGQDLDPDGPGNRPFTDYTTARNADRRRQYLEACADSLVGNLQSLVDDWSEERENNYRMEFLSDPGRAIWNMISGVRHFSGMELAGERLLVAWDTQAQEDEHSCFSDTTHQDIVFDARGLVNVYEGTYHRIDGEVIRGPGLKTIVSRLDPGAARALDRLVPLATELAAAIPEPFDQAILGDRDDAPGRRAVLELVEALEDQAAQWARVEQRWIAALRSGR